MSKCKKNYYIILFSMIFIFCIAGSSSAVMRGNYTTGIEFDLGTPTVFIEGTNSGDNELATVQFTADFDDLVAPTGKIKSVYISFTFDKDYLTFSGAHASGLLDGLVEDTDYWVTGDPNSNGSVVFTIRPENGASVDVIAELMELAYFEFSAKCQDQSNPNELFFADDISYIEVELATTPVQYDTYAPSSGLCTNGFVTTERYLFDFKIADQSFRGTVGGSISVPIYGKSNAMVDGVSFSITYDSEKLRFIEIENSEAYFPGGYSNEGEYVAPQAGDNPVHFNLTTGDAAMADLRGEILEKVLFNIKFEVLGEWDGDIAAVNFEANPEPYPIIFVKIAEGVDGYCDAVSQTMVNPWGSISVENGIISIPAYAAEFESRLVDDEQRIWNTGVADQTVKMAVKLGNNFDAGMRDETSYGAITAVVQQPSIFSRPPMDDGFLESTGDVTAFFDWDPDGLTGSVYQDYIAPLESNVVPISEIGVEGEGGVDLVYLNYTFNDAGVTGFSNTEYTLDFLSELVFPFYTHTTKVEASESNRTVTPGNGLTTTSTPFKVATGEFSCAAISSGSWDITQSYYLRSSFNLASFSVKVTVSGYHFVQDVDPATGVTAVRSPDGRSVTFTSNSNWVPGEFTTFKFADIDYGLTAPPLAAKAGPGTGDCYYRYKTSTIAFLNESMSDPTGNLPFLFTSAGNISQRTLICPEDPIAQDYKATHAVIPENFMLYQNYPNPFNPDTKIAFDLPEATHVRIEIFNILGQHVKTLVNGTKSAGSYEIYWNGTDDNNQKVSSGIYLYIMQAGDYSRSTKMTLMK